MSTETPTVARIEEDESPRLIAGLSERFEAPASAAVLWERFTPHLGTVPGQKGRAAYGVCSTDHDGPGMEYLCGVEVSGAEELPKKFSHRRLPPLRYAVFIHDGPVSTLRQTIDAIWNDSLPTSEFETNDEAGFFFERYGEDFDPQSGTGTIEIWAPIKG